MDAFTVVLVVILLSLGAGGSAYALHAIGWSPPQPPQPPPPSLQPDPPLEALPAGQGQVREVEVEIERLRGDLHSWLSDQEAQRTDQRARRDAELAALLARGVDELRRDLQARTDAALERVRAEVEAARAAEAERGPNRLRERRAEAVAELYGRLAKLEWTIVAVTSPIQLPGERFAVPAEFSPDMLKWESWKEVPEQAFAFADVFNQQRLLLEPAAADELEAFIATLRDVLTRAVYPNLQANPTADQLARLRGGLEQLTGALDRSRSCLQSQYQALTQG